MPPKNDSFRVAHFKPLQVAHLYRYNQETYGKVPPYVFLLAIDSDKSSSSKFLNSNNGVEIRLEPSELLICSGNKLTGKVNDFPQNYTWLSGNAISAIPALGSLGAPFASLGHFLDSIFLY